MNHPIVRNISFLLTYITAWLVVAGIHVATLTYLYEITIGPALFDALVFNSIFAVLGIALWYPVFFNDPEKQSIFNLVINHLSIMSLTLAFWVSVSIYICKWVLGDYINYLELIKHGVPWRIFVGTFYYFSLIMIYYLLIYMNSLRDHMVEEAKLKGKISEAELKSLKSQINPHFLFNSLNSISSLTITDPTKAHAMIIKLSSFLRYSLAHDPNNLIPLKQEIENMESYISVEKVRFGEKLIFETNINEVCLNRQVPFLVLQPLIENAIKHGVYESTEPIKVSVYAELENSEALKISINNGFDPDAVPQRGTGTGIRNIKERLKIIYQLNDLISFNKTETDFTVNLIIPEKPAIKKA